MKVYTVAKVINDINSVRRGKIWKRIINKIIGRYVVSKLWIR